MLKRRLIMKLTLNIEPGLTEKVKLIAKRKNTSISKMVESFFKKEVEQQNEPFRMKSEDEISDWVMGMVAATKPIPDFDHKAEYHKHLEEKFGL
jgi:hypothetical protein